MRVRERQNHNAETILIPKVRETEETKVMPAIRMEDEILPPTVRMENEVIPGDNDTNYPLKAIAVVHAYLVSGYPPNPAFDDSVKPYVVWFCKTLQHWKALVGVPIMDGKYYEVTFNGDKNEFYLDAYGKNENIRIPGGMFL